MNSACLIINSRKLHYKVKIYIEKTLIINIFDFIVKTENLMVILLLANR